MKPSKEVVRQYLSERTTSKTPVPSLAEIRRQLGWDLKPAERPWVVI